MTTGVHQCLMLHRSAKCIACGCLFWISMDVGSHRSPFPLLAMSRCLDFPFTHAPGRVYCHLSASLASFPPLPIIRSFCFLSLSAHIHHLDLLLPFLSLADNAPSSDLVTIANYSNDLLTSTYISLSSSPIRQVSTLDRLLSSTLLDFEAYARPCMVPLQGLQYDQLHCVTVSRPTNPIFGFIMSTLPRHGPYL